MSDQDIFNKQSEGKPPESNPTLDVFADQLKIIKNENGEQKYKDVPSALEALAHAQEYIKTLKAEAAQRNQELEAQRKEAETRESVKDLLQQFTNRGQEATAKENPPTKVSELDESKVVALIQNTLQQQDAVRTYGENLQKVTQALSDKFGENARQAIASRAVELGTTPEALRELSKQNPNMVLALFGDVKIESNKPMTPSSVNIPAKTGLPELEPPKRSVMRGGMTNQELAAEFRRHAEYTRKRLGISE